MHKAGDFILHLYGLLVPFEIKYTPNSPFGASIVEKASPLGTINLH